MAERASLICERHASLAVTVGRAPDSAAFLSHTSGWIGLRADTCGQITSDGRDVLHTQALSQFSMMQGETMPSEVPGSILGWYAAEIEETVAASGGAA